MRNKSILFSLFLLLLFSSVVLFANNDIMRALQDELNRSMRELKLDNLKSPYYIDYTLTLSNSNSVIGSLGNVNRIRQNAHKAELSVCVRVGDYKFDQKNFMDIGLNFFGSYDEEESYKHRSISIELDYATLRRELWLATDAAYKEAAELFSRKESALKNRVRSDTLWDLSPAKPTQTIDTTPTPTIDMLYARRFVSEVSEIFKNFPSIAASRVNYYLDTKTIYYISSEGTTYIKNENTAGVEVGAYTQAPDGMPLSQYYAALGHTTEDIPSVDSVKKAVLAIAGAMDNTTHAPVLDDSYSGPILITGQAACEIFAQRFIPCLSAQRDNVLAENIGFSTRSESFKAFQKKIGGRVLPTFMSVRDVPNQAVYNNIRLFGSYKIDDEGVSPVEVEIVKDGYLTTLLSDRTPIKRISESNGHSRGFSPAISNIIVNSNKKNKASYEELKKQMIQLCKKRDLPYGIIIKKLINENLEQTMAYSLGKTPAYQQGLGKIEPIEAYRLYQDGREELVRGGAIAGFSPATFKEIIKVGNTDNSLTLLQSVGYNYNRNGFSDAQLVTVIVPDLLLEDGEFQLLDNNFKKPPYLANPLSEKK